MENLPDHGPGEKFEPRIYYMSLFVLAIAVVVIIYLLRTRAQRQDDGSLGNTGVGSASTGTASAQPRPEGLSSVIVQYREAPDLAVDLRQEAHKVFRVVGSSHWVDPETLGRYAADYFFLHREPDNEYDSNAVAVYGGDRKFGYLEAAAAVDYAPLLDRMGADFVVPRDQNYYGGDQFRLPSLSRLRTRIDQGDLPYWHS